MKTTPPNIDELFHQAVEIDDPARRAAFLDAACGADASLRQEMEALLRHDQDGASFLESPPAGILDIETSPPSREFPGATIGRYKLLEQIGEGGMGVVFVAEQTEPVRRRVALKIIKPGMDTKQVIARFEAERQALAMMDHPNIARIFDAGTMGQASSLPEDEGQARRLPHDSRPYFVMELVRGLPITDYCDKARLTPRQRLELFIDVCLAVQHAHQKGIIHRDLKPSNVMVTVHDGRPVAKVIDFGVAKAVGQQLTERTVYTAHAQLVGTPVYMSPEQADLSSQDVDTRSDVYSLGVLLYELLTGQPPFDKETLHKAGFDEMRRIIREVEPETVSQRLARTRRVGQGRDSGRRPTATGSCFVAWLNPEPRTLNPSTELDWIVMKALEKTPSRRYESASALAADIQRYLAGDQVLACPPTTMYRFQKFARKHKPALATAAAIALCLLLGTTVSAWQAIRATTAEGQAEANEQKAVVAAATAQEKEQEAIKQRDEVKALADKLVAKEQQLQRTLYAAHMNLAHNAFEAGATARLRELLDQHRPKPGEPDLRGFEWQYLNRLFPADLLNLKHRGFAPSVAYSPDGKRLAITENNGTLIMWDAETGKMSFSTKPAGARTATFSPDGKRIFALPHILDAETGETLISLSIEAGPRFGAAFAPDGRRVAAGAGSAASGQIAIWDAQTGEQLRTLEGHSAQLRSLAFSPDCKQLASASWDKTVKLWDAETGQVLRTLERHTEPVYGVAYSPDGKRLASASGDNTVKLWDPLSGNEIRTLTGHISVVSSVAFSPDGKRLASASYDTTVKVWDVESGDELFALPGHTLGVWSVAFSPDGQRLASAGEGGTVKVREAKAAQKALVFGGGTAQVTHVAFTPDGKRLMSVDKRVAVEGHGSIQAKVWDTQSGEKLLTIDAGNIAASLSSDGLRLAVGRFKRERDRGNSEVEVDIRDALTGDKLVTIPCKFEFTRSQPAPSFRFSPDASQLFAYVRGATKMWDAKTGQEILPPEGTDWFKTFSPDGKRLVRGSGDATVRKVWDAQTGEELSSLQGHSGVITNIAFSPDNKRLATSSSDATIKVWDSQTGQELLTLAGHSGRSNGIAFSPDGNRLAAGGPNGTVMIYDATPLPEKPSP